MCVPYQSMTRAKVLAWDSLAKIHQIDTKRTGISAPNAPNTIPHLPVHHDIQSKYVIISGTSLTFSIAVLQDASNAFV